MQSSSEDKDQSKTQNIGTKQSNLSQQLSQVNHQQTNNKISNSNSEIELNSDLNNTPTQNSSPNKFDQESNPIKNRSFNSPFVPFTSSSFNSVSKLPTINSNGSPRSHRDPSILEDLTDDKKAQIIRKHLMSKEEQEIARRAQLLQSTSDYKLGSSPRSFPSQFENPSNLQQDYSSSITQEDYPTPFHLQGGDIHHAVYKWANKQQPCNAQTTITSTSNEESRANNLILSRTRSVSMSGTISRNNSEIGLNPFNRFSTNHSSSHLENHNPANPGLIYKDIMQPGGFRRAFLHQKRAAIGKSDNFTSRKPFTNSFIDFLSLYGHFGGEDLEEIDEKEEETFKALQRSEGLEDGESESLSSSSEEAAEEEESQSQRDEGDEGTLGVGERSRLLSSFEGRSSTQRKTGQVNNQSRNKLPKGKQTMKKKKYLNHPKTHRYPGFKDGTHGDANVTQAVLMLLKSLVGTGVLFLAKAFANGGLLFSILTIFFISFVSIFSFVLLVETRLQIPGGFGEIGGILYGNWFRNTILFSLVISQIGFVAAYTIFIAQNLQAFILAISKCQHLVPISLLIAAQLVVYLPLAMIRNIQKLSGTALVADVFILIGLVYVFAFELSSIAQNGVAPVKLFNPESFSLLIGTAVFTYEGIGLIIPITESMKEPQKFPSVLTGVMISLTVLFAGAGAMGYAAFGQDVQSVVLLNLPQDNKIVNAVQFLYSIAIMLSTPLQLFPAVRIMENAVFSSSGKYSNQVKWQKNMFRTIAVIVCGLIAWAGASDLDKFVSLIGSVACVPLCFCYPAMLHYRAIAKTRRQKISDIALFVFGITAAVYTTYQTVTLLVNDNTGTEAAPKLGACLIP